MSIKATRHNAIAIGQRGKRNTSLVGEHAQIFQVDGDLYYKTAVPDKTASPTVYPLAPIPDPGLCVGRETSISHLGRFFSQKSAKVFILEGLEGIGKTTCAACACRTHRKLFRAVFWKNMSPDMSVRQVIEALFGFTARCTNSSLSEIGFHLDYPIRSQIHGIIEQLTRHNYLLVFDDFHACLDLNGHFINPDIELLFQELLCDGHHSKLLLISKRRVSFGQYPVGVLVRHRLKGLDAESARTLLSTVGMDVFFEHIKALHAKVGGHPKALHLLADLHEHGYSPERLQVVPFSRLSKESRRLHDKIFSDIQQFLGKDARQVLQALSAYRVPVTDEAVRDMPVREILSADAFHLYRIFRILYDHCLIENQKMANGLSVYRIPGIVREWVFETNKERNEFCILLRHA